MSTSNTDRTPPQSLVPVDTFEITQSLSSSTAALTQLHIRSSSVESPSPKLQKMHRKHAISSYCMGTTNSSPDDFAATAKCTASWEPLSFPLLHSTRTLPVLTLHFRLCHPYQIRPFRAEERQIVLPAPGPHDLGYGYQSLIFVLHHTYLTIFRPPPTFDHSYN